MTLREMYEVIANGEPITEEIQELAKRRLELMDEENSKRKEKNEIKRKEKIENEKELVNSIVNFLEKDNFKTATDICENFEEIKTPQKATILVKRAISENKVICEKIKNPYGKGKVNGYKAI